MSACTLPSQVVHLESRKMKSSRKFAYLLMHKFFQGDIEKEKKNEQKAEEPTNVHLNPIKVISRVFAIKIYLILLDHFKCSIIIASYLIVLKGF